MDWSIREVRPDDAEGIVDVINPIIEAGIYTVFDAPFTTESEREYILNFPPRGVFNVAIERPQERVVGFQSMEPFASYTHAFDHVGVLGTYVDLSCRRKGIAKGLFAATLEAATAKGYEKIFTYIRADNDAALTTYANHGFRVVGRAHRHAKINGAYVDEIMVERFLEE